MSERAASGQNIGSIIFLSAFRFFFAIFLQWEPYIVNTVTVKIGRVLSAQGEAFFLFKYKEAKNKRVAS